VVKTEPQPASFTSSAYGAEVGMMETMGTEVASIEESYVEEGYDDYGEYEGQGYEAVGQIQGYNEGSSGSSETVFDDGTAQCNLCGKKFARKYECSRHVKTVHEEITVPASISCSICGKIFKNSQSLKTHMRGVHYVYSTK